MRVPGSEIFVKFIRIGQRREIRNKRIYNKHFFIVLSLTSIRRVQRNIIPDIQGRILLNLDILCHSGLIRYRERNGLCHKIVREFTVYHNITRFCTLTPFYTYLICGRRFPIHLYITYRNRSGRLECRGIFCTVRHRDPGIFNIQKVDPLHGHKHLLCRPIFYGVLRG